MQEALWRGSQFDVVESMDTIHCQDALDSPHTDSWKDQDFRSLTGVKLQQSNVHLVFISVPENAVAFFVS